MYRNPFSFWSGMGRAIDLFGTRRPFVDFGQDPYEVDAESMNADSKATQRDLECARNTLLKTHERLIHRRT